MVKELLDGKNYLSCETRREEITNNERSLKNAQRSVTCLKIDRIGWRRRESIVYAYTAVGELTTRCIRNRSTSNEHRRLSCSKVIVIAMVDFARRSIFHYTIQSPPSIRCHHWILPHMVYRLRLKILRRSQRIRQLLSPAWENRSKFCNRRTKIFCLKTDPDRDASSNKRILNVLFKKLFNLSFQVSMQRNYVNNCSHRRESHENRNVVTSCNDKTIVHS